MTQAETTSRAKGVFADALERPAAERAAFVEAACAGDPALKAVVDVLLVAHGSAAGFMDSPLTRPTSPPALLEAPGTVIGRYKLLDRIGEGGFGTVFLAEQREPVVRLVALKIIKLGMDTRQVTARFELERQALALMDHPNIAKVLDGGATDTGRPYFVMELVRGRPITQYCDDNNLGVRQRLELFEQVCDAVQHAHQKGTIHRDIKPCNVLVTVADDKPVPKIIDFGIAKAMAARLTEQTLFTDHGSLIGTPEYMSPEQAARGLDIDTRSDIYSLGVMLYELLTSLTPFDPRELRAAAFGEVQRIIREVEPPKPSTRLSGLKDTIASVAARRHAEPTSLPAMVRGDLDWIVMKCLEKDRLRRYATAHGLAQDVRRHLSGEPVLAAPPGAGYRARKFIRKHRVGVLAGAAIASAVVLGLAGTTIGFVQARAQRDRAERIAAFMEDTLRGVSTTVAAGNEPATLRQMLDTAADRINRGELKDSPEAEVRLRLSIGGAFRQIGAGSAGTAMIEPAVALARSAAPGGSLLLAEALMVRAGLVPKTDRQVEAEPLYREALEIRTRLLGEDHADVAASLQWLALAVDRQGRESEALALRERWLRICRRVHPGDHRDYVEALTQVGMSLWDHGRSHEAEPLFAEANTMWRRMNPRDPLARTWVVFFHARCLKEIGRPLEAQAELVDARTALLQKFPNDSRGLVLLLIDLGGVHAALGRLADAEADFREAVAMAGRMWPQGDSDRARALRQFAAFLVSQGRLDEARAPGTEAASMAARLHYLMCMRDRAEMETLLADLGIPAPAIPSPSR